MSARAILLIATTIWVNTAVPATARYDATAAGGLRWCGSVYVASDDPSSDHKATRIGVSVRNMKCRVAKRHGRRMARGGELPRGWTCTGNTALTCKRGQKRMLLGIRTIWR